MKTIAEMMRERVRAAEREKRIHRLTAEWEAGDYITATDAAKEIGMSPARFRALLRQERNRLPIESNDLALELSGAIIMEPIERPFYDRGINLDLNFIKIHRLDWSAYIASATDTGAPASTGSNKDNTRIHATRRACETVGAEIEQGLHGFQVQGEYKTNQHHFQQAVQVILGDVKPHRDTAREEWGKVREDLKHSGRVPEQ